jgi:enamine deaminase RidA (YjgF/YER057c/UK114 family)
MERQHLKLMDMIAATGKCRAEAYAGTTQPAGTFLVVTALAWPGMLIEVDVTASTPK